LQSQQFIERVAAYSNGVSYPAISPSDLANLEIWWPPNGLQTAIADYLDVETARIDALIEKKQRLIELLHDQVEARRSSLIASNTRAGRIRWRWPRRRNKEFVRESHRRSVTGEETMLSVSHLTGVTPRSEKTVYMFEAESTVGYKLVEPGDLVINTMWAWMGAAGTSKVRGIVSPAYGVYSIDRCKVEPDWVDLVVRSRPYIIEMTRYSRGVTSSRLRLYPAEFLALFMPIPPIDEQRRITRRFTVAVENRRRAQRALTRQIELLGERRQALITAAVTGEFTVPGVP
jgi:type I restriction enzyme S subunit